MGLPSVGTGAWGTGVLLGKRAAAAVCASAGVVLGVPCFAGLAGIALPAGALPAVAAGLMAAGMMIGGVDIDPGVAAFTFAGGDLRAGCGAATVGLAEGCAAGICAACFPRSRGFLTGSFLPGGALTGGALTGGALAGAPLTGGALTGEAALAAGFCAFAAGREGLDAATF